MHAHFQLFARYNAWANSRLYAAAAALTDAQYRADRGAFFKSVHGTLNHLLATDRIWFQRITGNAATGPVPDRLDAILCDDLTALHAARVAACRAVRSSHRMASSRSGTGPVAALPVMR